MYLKVNCPLVDGGDGVNGHQNGGERKDAIHLLLFLERWGSQDALSSICAERGSSMNLEGAKDLWKALRVEFEDKVSGGHGDMGLLEGLGELNVPQILMGLNVEDQGLGLRGSVPPPYK